MTSPERPNGSLPALTFTLSFLVLLVLGTATLAAPMLEVIGQWHRTVDLPDDLADGRTIFRNGYLFVVGGNKNGDPTNKVRVAEIRTDGDLSAWQSTSSLPTPLMVHAVVAGTGHVYAVGGYDGNDAHNEIWRAPFIGNNQLGSWQHISDYPMDILMHDAVMSGDRIYVVGGTSWSSSERTNKVYSVAVLGNGDLGAWREERSLLLALYRLSATAHVDHIYVTGGYDGDQRSDRVYYANVLGDGSLGSWQTISMPEPREYHRALIHDGRLVLLGGRNGDGEIKSVRSAAIQPDGNLSGWNAEPDLPRELYRLGAVTARVNDSDSIYVLGGLSADNDDYRDEVYHSDVSQAPPTDTPQAPPTGTPTYTPTPTNTPTSTTSVVPPIYLPLIQNKLSTPDELTFEGLVSALEFGPLVDFRHVQVRGSNEANHIGELLYNAQTGGSGLFTWTVPADKRYDYYFLSVYPVEWGDKYEVDTVQPGANGGEVWNDEYIRFDIKNLGDGWYDGNTFILKEKE